MQNNKITSRPPTKKSVEDFILEAEKKGEIIDKQKENTLKHYPWENNQVRDDVQKVFTVKLPEAYILKIKYISEITNKSQQKIVREIICNELDVYIKKLNGGSKP